MLPGALTSSILRRSAPLVAIVPFTAVKALYGFETDLSDESGNGHDITANGSFGRSSDTAKFGTYSAGRTSSSSASRGTVAHSADFIFDGAFTIELWQYCNGTGGVRAGVLSKYETTGDEKSWSIELDSSSHYKVLLSTDGSTDDYSFTTTGTYGDSTWRHICLERDDADTVRFYIDGVVMDSVTLSGSLYNNASTAMEVCGVDGGNANAGDRVDEIRITKGYARYGGAFTPPTEAFPRS